MISVNFRLSFPTTGALISLLFSFLLAAPVLAQMSEAAPSIAKVLTLDDAIKALELDRRIKTPLCSRQPVRQKFPQQFQLD
jgi:hypothetical protein